MASGTFVLACLLLTAGAGPADAVHLNQRSFQIPIKIDPERRPLIAQVQLFRASKDGAVWDQVGAVPPERDAFTFYATEDGSYQFKVGVEGKDKRKDPPDIYQAPVGLRVIVDTKAPQLRVVQAERQGDDVLVRWDVVEEHPDLASLKLEYRTSDGLGGLWREAKVADPASNSARVRVTEGTPVAVRVKMEDLATNSSGWVEAPVAGAAAAAPAPSPGATAAGVPALPPIGGTPTPAAPSGGPSPIGDNTAWTPGGPAGTMPPPMPLRQVSTDAAAMTAAQAKEPLLNGVGARTTVLASGTSGADATARPGQKPLPELAWARTRQITLDYEVAKFGASGIGSVQLFVTRDDGRTWTPSGGEENVSVSAAPGAKGLPTTLTRSLSVTVPEDGSYGFYMVVRSGAGLGNAPPVAGTSPQMRIEVDTKAPEAKLYAPEPDLAKRDSLVLRWTALDKNLGPTPISLEWSEDRNDWKEIGKNLPHTAPLGEHVWRVPPTVPPRVYLRLTVRDRAGNESVAITDEPQIVDLNEPEVKSLKLGGSK